MIAMTTLLLSSRRFSAARAAGTIRPRTSARRMVAQRVVDISGPFQGFRSHRYVERQLAVST
jgi:hypothetical protein